MMLGEDPLAIIGFREIGAPVGHRARPAGAAGGLPALKVFG